METENGKHNAKTDVGRSADEGKRVELFHAGIREKGTIQHESFDKKYWIVTPDDPRVTTKMWKKDRCTIDE